MINALASRTNWTIVLSVVLNAVQMSEPFLSPELFLLLQSVVGAVAIYFRTFPRLQAE